jgi:uroporphyrinogen decarboxylase
MLAEFVRDTGVHGIGVDTSADLATVRECVPATVAIQGNLDPLALLVGGQALTRETDAILAAMQGRAFIFNLGHGIVPQTPPAHVAALVARVRAV